MLSELLQLPNFGQAVTWNLDLSPPNQGCMPHLGIFIFRSSCAHALLPSQELNLYVIIPLASATVFRDCPVPKHVS